jgi:phage terminase large subunit GpA-like protein
MPGDVFEQLTAERLVTRYVKGHAKREWVKPAGKRNEALDGAVYALAAAHFAGIERWREGEWHKWEQRVQARDLVDDMAGAPELPAPAVQEAAAAEAAGEVVVEPPPAPAEPVRRRPQRGRFGKGGGWAPR